MPGRRYASVSAFYQHSGIAQRLGKLCLDAQGVAARNVLQVQRRSGKYLEAAP
jgi:hypothetical protein